MQSSPGSVLDPLPFLLYINNTRVLPGENVKLFANDANLFKSGVDISVLQHKHNYCIETLNRWFVYNCPYLWGFHPPPTPTQFSIHKEKTNHSTNEQLNPSSCFSTCIHIGTDQPTNVISYIVCSNECASWWLCLHIKKSWNDTIILTYPGQTWGAFGPLNNYVRSTDCTSILIAQCILQVPGQFWNAETTP